MALRGSDGARSHNDGGVVHYLRLQAAALVVDKQSEREGCSMAAMGAWCHGYGMPWHHLVVTAPWHLNSALSWGDASEKRPGRCCGQARAAAKTGAA